MCPPSTGLTIETRARFGHTTPVDTTDDPAYTPPDRPPAEAQAASTGDLTADAGAAVSRAGDRYTWVQRLPCNAYERAHPEYCTEGTTTELHHDKDYLHFCLEPMTKDPKPCVKRSPGVMRYCQAIAATVAQHARGHHRR